MVRFFGSGQDKARTTTGLSKVALKCQGKGTQSVTLANS